MKNSSSTSFEISRSAQYRTVQELIEHSRPDFTYYVLLVVSTVIITAGLLLNNSAIVIGGMLVTPLLTPTLVIALGISVGDMRLIARVSKFVGISFIYVLIAGLLLTVVFGAPEELVLISDSLRTSILYFVVAISAGIAATLAWIDKETSEVLPGIAIAVSLVPPLGMIGIGLGSLQFDIAASFFTVFVLNVFGILMGSLTVFSLTKFNNVDKVIKDKNEEIIVEEHLQKLEKEEERKEHEPKKDTTDDSKDDKDDGVSSK